jgi:halocyanin-like protein
MDRDFEVRRREVLLGAAAGTALLAGCGGGGSGDASFDGWLDGVSNFDGDVDDRTGESEVTVTVGAEGNNGNLAFAPAAVRVSTGTAVVWEWNGEGGRHNVHAMEGGSFQSDTTNESGHTFSQTFEETGAVKYQCDPHVTLGMKGVVDVVE